jgi:hypothetical protein
MIAGFYRGSVLGRFPAAADPVLKVLSFGRPTAATW